MLYATRNLASIQVSRFNRSGKAEQILPTSPAGEQIKALNVRLLDTLKPHVGGSGSRYAITDEAGKTIGHLKLGGVSDLQIALDGNMATFAYIDNPNLAISLVMHKPPTVRKPGFSLDDMLGVVEKALNAGRINKTA